MRLPLQTSLDDASKSEFDSPRNGNRAQGTIGLNGRMECRQQAGRGRIEKQGPDEPVRKQGVCHMKKELLTGVFGAAMLAASAASAATLDDVKAKGFVQCGVSTGLAGFSAPNDKGEWSGLDVDLCRAVAAARPATSPET